MKSKKFIFLICVILAVSAIYLYWGNNSITVSEYSVYPQNLPQSFDGYRIVQISDLHNKDFGSELPERIEKLNPDIIVITGDIIDSRRTKTEISEEFINNICKIAPIYYVTGNHEKRIGEYEEFKIKTEQAGVCVLEGETVTLTENDEEICLAGIDDLNFFGSHILDEDKIAFSEKLKEIKAKTEGKTSILLSHRPELFEIYAENSFDVVFSGHAHGGQIRLPFIGGMYSPSEGFFPKYTQGVYESGKTSMIVSRGLGNSLFPFRIGNRPEIVVCELKGK